MFYEKKKAERKNVGSFQHLNSTLGKSDGFSAYLPEISRKTGNSFSLTYTASINHIEPVIQRIVTIDLKPETKVYIVRSTEPNLHGMQGTIKEYIGNNMYRVEVESTIYKIRTDQLSMVPSNIPPLDVDINALSSMQNDQIIDTIMTQLNDKFGIKNAVIGGSFAVMLNSNKTPQYVRTPRDIDILVKKENAGNLSEINTENGVINTNVKVFGLPIELHIIEKSGNMKFGITEIEERRKYSSANTLLLQEARKLASKSDLYRTWIYQTLINGASNKYFLSNLHSHDKDVSSIYAKGVMEQDIQSQNPSQKTIPSLHFGSDIDDMAAIWSKTLVDIEVLINSGASVKYLWDNINEFSSPQL